MNSAVHIQFSAAEVETFRRASHDQNPLHTDAEYARRGPFGRPVVYGVLAILKALGTADLPPGAQVKSLRAVFKKPFYQGESYQLHQEERSDGLFLALRRGPADYMHLQVGVGTLPSATATAEIDFSPLDRAQDRRQEAAQMLHYLPEASAAHELRSLCGTGKPLLSEGQLSALLWASYRVGMELPGRQALFAELELRWEAAQTGPGLALSMEASDFDERFNRSSEQGRGSGLDKLRIVAFRRPEAVVPDYAAWLAQTESPKLLAGKRVFVSGATRGFGAALAVTAAGLGARVALNYRTENAVLKSLQSILREHDVDLLPLQGDMAKEADVVRIAQTLREDWGGLDCIANNAYPQIRNLQFFEQRHGETMAFLQSGLGIGLLTARHVLPILEAGGIWLEVSTKYLANRTKGFAHYTLAKAAAKDLCQSLATEHPKWRFAVAQLPAMLTDQTNLPFHLSPPADPLQTAHKVWMALMENHPNNFTELDIEEGD